MDRTIDYSPLFVAPTRDEVIAFRRATMAARPAAQSEQIVLIASWVLGGFMVVALGFSLLVPALVSLVAVSTGRLDPVELAGVLPPLVIIVVVTVLVVRALLARRFDWERRLRMSRFAAANGLLYEPVSEGPSYPGAIFGIGSSRQVTDHFRTTDDRYLDFGNYRYVTGSGKSRTTHHWGFLALHLDRALPHMLLDSRANNGLMGSTNLPAVFSRDQVLSLEGDFDRYFTLYCPAEYERDALYVFTPDLMALLIDEAAPYDVEIIDRWMLVYSARPFPLADPATYQRLLGIVSTVGAKTLTQTDRYVDERIGQFAANIVAPQGQRLRRGVSWVGIAVIAVFLIVWVGGIVSSYLR
ncbi:hypothetical protein [Microcella sp.]|uniref:hypothetical protein n=1 Tax=Microcella sp. TaxID=1913979 RepID=UPI003F6E533B